MLLLGVSFAGGVISAATGVGGGLLMLAVLASTVPPTAVIPIHGVVQIGANLGRVMVLFRNIAWSVVPGFLGGAVIGASIGGVTVVNIPPPLIKIALGLFILWAVLGRPPAFLSRHGWVSGLISTFLTMFFGASAPFVLVYLRTLGLGRMEQVGTHATLMTLQHLLKTMVFGFLGFAFGPWLGLVAGLFVTGLLGTLIGRMLLGRMSDKRFGKIVSVVLLLLAARLIWMGLTEAGVIPPIG